jgi:putative ABC transport system permease protein
MRAISYWFKQFRRSSFRILFLALVLAVAAIASVGVFAARIDAALQRDASQMLGGNLVLESTRNPSQAAWQAVLQKTDYAKVSKASSVQFPSVVSTATQDVLVSAKAVSEAYPLLGSLRIRNAQGKETEVAYGPEPGQVWVDQQVLDTLGLQLGQVLTLGQTQQVVSKVIVLEPERNGGFVNFAPRVMFHMNDLNATGLLGMGSRAKWRQYFTGPQAQIKRLEGELTPLLSASDEFQSIEKGRPEIAKTLDIAKDFLSMAALIASMIASVGIALSSHQFAKEQSQEMAVLKSLGFTPQQLLITSVQGLLMLSVFAGTLGVGLGWCAHWGLLTLLSGLVGVHLPWAGLYYIPLSMLLSLILLLGFAVLPLWRALQTPAMAVIRQQTPKTAQTRQGVWAVSLGCLCALGMCLLVVKNIKLALLLFVGFLVSALVFAFVFIGLLAILAKLLAQRQGAKAGINILHSMSKRSSSLVLQGVALSMGLSALLILAVVQGDLIQRWQAAIPEHAPNRFIFNIQPDQAATVQTELERVSPSTPRLYPMVRGRLLQINEQAISAQTYTDQRAQNLVQREFNLSYAQEKPSHNKIIQGQWFNPNIQAPQISLEKSMAERLGLKLGDRLGFDISGTLITAEVSSIRELRWDSMEVNFFAIFPTATLPDFPQTWITSVYLPPNQASAVGHRLLGQFPNLTLLDTEQLLAQIKKILAQVSQAVQFVFLFTVLAGGLVVLSCMLVGGKERIRHAAIYRALGASTQQLRQAAWIELGVLGILSGLVAAFVAQGVGWGVARFIFQFDYVLSPEFFLIGGSVGIIQSFVFAYWSVNTVSNAPVMHTLRQS